MYGQFSRGWQRSLGPAQLPVLLVVQNEKHPSPSDSYPMPHGLAALKVPQSARPFGQRHGLVRRREGGKVEDAVLEPMVVRQSSSMKWTVQTFRNAEN
jgi:hypothetical protein